MSSGSWQSAHSVWIVLSTCSADPERVPAAVGEPRASTGIDPERGRPGRERIGHPDFAVFVQDEGVAVVEATPAVAHRLLGEPGQAGDLGR
jgi:hypothetical protein